MYFDCSQDALRQLDIVSREVYLPLLCTDTTYATNYGMSADKLMDVLHRLMATVETTQGHTEVLSFLVTGSVMLNLILDLNQFTIILKHDLFYFNNMFIFWIIYYCNPI